VHGYNSTATLQVQDYYDNFNTQGAYAISLLLAALAVLVLVAMMILRPEEEHA
jgi:ABC-type sulfate transport system permease subunit